MQPQYASVPQGQPQYQQQQYVQGQPQQPQYMQAQPQYQQQQYQQQQYGQPMYMQPSSNNVVLSPAQTTYSGGNMMDGSLVPQGAMAQVNGQIMQVSMAPPAAPSGTPRGLEYFAVLDQIWVKEIPQLLDQLQGVDLNQRYQCLNASGHQVYFAQESTDCCTRQCFHSARPFLINIHDPTQSVVMKLQRPLRCASSWCCLLPINCCCLQHVTVTDAMDNVLGHLVQRFALCNPQIDICDENFSTLLTIEAPYCICPGYGDVDFQLLMPGTTQSVGVLSKKWGGIMREVFIGNADNFYARFPMDLPIRSKALIFAATFLIDFMYFEDRKKKNENRNNDF